MLLGSRGMGLGNCGFRTSGSAVGQGSIRHNRSLRSLLFRLPPDSPQNLMGYGFAGSKKGIIFFEPVMHYEFLARDGTMQGCRAPPCRFLPPISKRIGTPPAPWNNRSRSSSATPVRRSLYRFFLARIYRISETAGSRLPAALLRSAPDWAWCCFR